MIRTLFLFDPSCPPPSPERVRVAIGKIIVRTAVLPGPSCSVSHFSAVFVADDLDRCKVYGSFILVRTS